MTIQDIGSIGELIAAVATVATLAYLAVQIHFEMLLMLYNNSLTQTFQLYRHGAVDEDLWDQTLRQIDWITAQKGYQVLLAKWASNMPPEFLRFIEARQVRNEAPESPAAQQRAAADSA